GRIYPVEVTSCYIQHKGQEYELAYAVDISDRKKAEQHYRSVVENAHDAIYTIHPRRGFQYVNPAFEELTGYTAEEIYSDTFSFWDILHPDDVAMIEERGKARKSGETVPDRYEFRIIARDGTTKTLEATTVDIGAGDEALVMGILRDVTEREQAIREMERALELEKRFKADAAHFFLNPIAIAKGYMELALENMPDECRNKITASRNAIKRVEQVIKNIVEKGEIHE
ncbi:MAG: PAS domain S-box protein, partial [Thermoplasmatota archaeon]